MKITLKPLELARLEIVRLKLRRAGDLRRAAHHALEISAHRLQVARVGIWLIAGDGTALQRIITFAPGAPEEEVLLPLAQWPAYAEALFSRRVVAADDALTDPRTMELIDVYLAPRGITSMLDVPLFLEGEVRGVVCHEHVGARRAWSPEEIDFATSVADMVTALLEQSMRLALEQQLREEDRISARAHHLRVLARTAAGIGHDVNTILQSITLDVERARKEREARPREELLAQVLEDCKRGARIVNQLRELEASPGASDAEVDLALVVRAMRPIFDTLAGNCSIEVEAPPAAILHAARTDVERIFLNLVTNASEATRTGGTIRIVVSADDHGTRLAVSDDGPGIDEGQMEEIFEPYITSKGGRHGGLGLFVVQTLASRSGAVVSVDSARGAGATFTVAWPPTAP